MASKLRAMADRLVARFAPEVEASAGCNPFCYAPGYCPVPICGSGACIVYADCSFSC